MYEFDKNKLIYENNRVYYLYDNLYKQDYIVEEDYCKEVDEKQEIYIDVTIPNKEDIDPNYQYVFELLKKYNISSYFLKIDSDEERDVFYKLFFLRNRSIVNINGVILIKNCEQSIECDFCNNYINNDENYKWYIDAKKHSCLSCEFDKEKLSYGEYCCLECNYDFEYNKTNISDNDIKNNDKFNFDLDITDDHIIVDKNTKYLIDSTGFGSIFDWYPILIERNYRYRFLLLCVNKKSKYYNKFALCYKSNGLNIYVFNKDVEWLCKLLKNIKEGSIVSLSSIMSYFNYDLLPMYSYYFKDFNEDNDWNDFDHLGNPII